jgi:hypothetical protein
MVGLGQEASQARGTIFTKQEAEESLEVNPFWCPVLLGEYAAHLLPSTTLTTQSPICVCVYVRSPPPASRVQKPSLRLLLAVKGHPVALPVHFSPPVSMS